MLIRDHGTRDVWGLAYPRYISSVPALFESGKFGSIEQED